MTSNETSGPGIQVQNFEVLHLHNCKAILGQSFSKGLIISDRDLVASKHQDGRVRALQISGAVARQCNSEGRGALSER